MRQTTVGSGRRSRFYLLPKDEDAESCISFLLARYLQQTESRRADTPPELSDRVWLHLHGTRPLTPKAIRELIRPFTSRHNLFQHQAKHVAASLLEALGWSHDKISTVLHTTRETLRKVYLRGDIVVASPFPSSSALSS